MASPSITTRILYRSSLPAPGDMKSFVVILISLHLAFAKEAFEITQGLEEDPGDALHLAFFFGTSGRTSCEWGMFFFLNHPTPTRRPK